MLGVGGGQHQCPPAWDDGVKGRGGKPMRRLSKVGGGELPDLVVQVAHVEGQVLPGGQRAWMKMAPWFGTSKKKCQLSASHPRLKVSELCSRLLLQQVLLPSTEPLAGASLFHTAFHSVDDFFLLLLSLL